MISTGASVAATCSTRCIDGSQPRLFADDRVGHILAIEPGEQRPLVRLERFAQPGHLVQPGVIGEGNSNRFEERLHERLVRRVEAALRRHNHQHAERPFVTDERPDQERPLRHAHRHEHCREWIGGADRHHAARRRREPTATRP